MKVALPYFAIKEFIAAPNAATSENANIKRKHVLKILDLCLAWHHRNNPKIPTDAMASLRKTIARQWYNDGSNITTEEVSKLQALALSPSDGDVHEAIPPTAFREVLRFHDDVSQKDREWTEFVLRLLSADEADVRHLQTNLTAARDPRMLLGNVQAACLLMRSRRLQDGDCTTYVDACLSHLSTLSSYDHGPLVEALRALKFLNKQTTTNTQRGAHIAHMIRVSEGIRTVNEARGSAGGTPGSKEATYELVSGSATDLTHALQTEEHDKQKRLPCFFATEVLATLQKSPFVSSLAPKEQMRITRAFDARFPNMAEATMLAVGERWLELAGVASSAAFVTVGLTEEDFPPLAPIINHRLPKQKNKRPPTKFPSGFDETPEAAVARVPSKPSAPHDEATQRVLAACGSANGLDKPPRGAYLRVAPSCDDEDAARLRSCIQSDLAFKKTFSFYDERQNDRAIADYLIEKIDTIRAASKAHFGRRRVARVSRPPYAMSPWTAV
jgi:hypothetical protein